MELLKKQEGVRLFYPGNIMNIQVERANIPAGGGLDKKTNKQLLIKHLEHHRKGYIENFVQVLKDVPKYTVNRYLKELKDEETIELIGNPKITKGDKKAYWRLKQ